MEFSEKDYERAKRVVKKAQRGKKLTLDELNLKADPFQKVAHLFAKPSLRGNFPIDWIVDKKDYVSALQIANDEGWTVAHELAKNGYPFRRSPEVDRVLLTSKTKYEGITPLHVLAMNYPLIFMSLFSPKEKEFYTVPDSVGITPAHVIVMNGYFPFSESDKEILLLPTNLNGSTVLEIAVVKGLLKEVKDEELKNSFMSIGVKVGDYLSLVNSVLPNSA